MSADDPITPERIDALVAEYAAITAHVRPRAARMNTAQGYRDTPPESATVDWSIADEFVGHWEDSYCGQTDHNTIYLSFEAAGMTDVGFDAHVERTTADTGARHEKQERAKREQEDASERRELAELQARIAAREAASNG